MSIALMVFETGSLNLAPARRASDLAWSLWGYAAVRAVSISGAATAVPWITRAVSAVVQPYTTALAHRAVEHHVCDFTHDHLPRFCSGSLLRHERMGDLADSFRHPVDTAKLDSRSLNTDEID
jgi:hypothetical protein